MTIEHEATTVHTIYGTDQSRPTITVRTLMNGNTKFTQSVSWISMNDSELNAVINALFELRPDLFVDAPEDE